VPGGGIALLNASQKIKANSKGEQLLLNAITAPYKTILQNAGLVPDMNVNRVGWGIDVITGNPVNMVKHGVIDPVLVTKSALKNAVSVATTIVSADCIISNKRLGDASN
jgi:chaperonin GroEL